MRIHVLDRGVKRLSIPIRCLIGLGGLLLLCQTSGGCLGFPDASERIDDEIVYTHYDKKADFEEFQTFAISPEVAVISEEDDGDGEIERDTLEADEAEQLVERVAENLTERGYRQVNRDEQPDLGITITVLSGTVSSYYYSYWGSYWGYPSYYYYYPYSYYEYSYSTGTVVVDAVDLKNIEIVPSADAGVGGGDAGVSDPAGRLDVSWTGLVYGVLSGNGAEDMQGALLGIDQAFRQSPYFRANRSE